jgi:hypothetical protein
MSETVIFSASPRLASRVSILKLPLIYPAAIVIDAGTVASEGPEAGTKTEPNGDCGEADDRWRRNCLLKGDRSVAWRASHDSGRIEGEALDDSCDDRGVDGEIC